MIVLMLCALMASSGIFFGLNKLGDYLVWTKVTNITEEQKREKNRELMNDLQKFVNINRLKVSEAQQTNKWTSGQHVNLVFYQDRDLIYYERETSSGDSNFQSYLSDDDRKKYDETLKNILEGNEDAYPISFMDGTLLVTFVDTTESFLESMVMAVSLGAAVVFFSVSMLLYFNHITHRIRRLAKDVNKAENGNFEVNIHDGGNDEIGMLAQDINSMKNTVVENMSKEREAWEANAGLITAMSHDIRTPLTVMMGYIDLMEIQNEDPSMGEYLDACKQNAQKLKKLSDDMFSYFLVFGKRDFELNITETYADRSIRHMLEEHCILFAETGYDVSTCWNCTNVKVRIDEKYFGRVIDNIFSNISKYAEPTKPVRITIFATETQLVIRTENIKRTDISDTESNRIGNKTCQKITEQLHGSFVTKDLKEKFINEISLPLVLDGKR